MTVPATANQKCTSTSRAEYMLSRFHSHGTDA